MNLQHKPCWSRWHRPLPLKVHHLCGTAWKTLLSIEASKSICYCAMVASSCVVQMPHHSTKAWYVNQKWKNSHIFKKKYLNTTTIYYSRNSITLGQFKKKSLDHKSSYQTSKTSSERNKTSYPFFLRCYFLWQNSLLNDRK